MDAFGLSARGLQEPEAVLHILQSDEKYIAGPQYKPLTKVRPPSKHNAVDASPLAKPDFLLTPLFCPLCHAGFAFQLLA